MVPSCIGCPCFLSNSFFLVPFSSLFPLNGSPGTLLFYLLLATLRSEFLKTFFPWLMQFLLRSLLELDLSFFTISHFLSVIQNFLVRIVVGWFTVTILGGRHLVDIIGIFSWTKRVTSRGHIWWHLMDIFWVTFRGHLIVMIRLTLLSSNKLTQT